MHPRFWTVLVLSMLVMAVAHLPCLSAVAELALSSFGVGLSIANVIDLLFDVFRGER